MIIRLKVFTYTIFISGQGLLALALSRNGDSASASTRLVTGWASAALRESSSLPADAGGNFFLCARTPKM